MAKIGQGMHPRGVKPAGAKPAEKHTQEGQPESVLEPFLERETQAVTDHGETPETLQNLEQKNSVSVALPEASELEKAMRESAEPQADTEDVQVAFEQAKEDSGLKWPEPDHSSQLGDREDGSFGVVVTIKEGYVEAIRQWAEADGLSMEEWLSMRLLECYETYGEPARGR